MEKSLEQLKHIQRSSRQTRHYRTHLNRICDQHLRVELDHLAQERERSISRSASRRKLEEKRRKSLGITVEQIANEREYEPSINNSTIQIGEEISEILSSKVDDSRPSSSVRLPSPGSSCRLFSHNCQLYPCQPVYQYTSIISKEHDQIFGQRDSSTALLTKSLSREQKIQQDRRRIRTARHDHDLQMHRYLSTQRTMATLNEQSRLLHERLADRRTFGFSKERQYQLTQDIQRHLNITAKFCT